MRNYGEEARRKHRGYEIPVLKRERWFSEKVLSRLAFANAKIQANQDPSSLAAFKGSIPGIRYEPRNQCIHAKAPCIVVQTHQSLDPGPDHPVSSSSAVPSLLHLDQHARPVGLESLVTYGIYLAPASSMFCLTSSGNCSKEKCQHCS